MNHGPVVVPCNLVIQMPANTFTWADFVNGGPGLGLGGAYPSFEIRAVGNVVGARRIAGLLYASQQFLHTSTGVITAIDYATGNLKVDTGDAANPATVQINDPNGRFGRKTSGRVQSPDPRFSVDDANPTIHSGTGYPMCVRAPTPRSPTTWRARSRTVPTSCRSRSTGPSWRLSPVAAATSPWPPSPRPRVVS